MIDRRTFLGVAAATLLWPAPRVFGAHHEAGEKSAAPKGLSEAALEKTGFVYVSPLLGNGKESHCHGEVWYGWLGGAVVIITSQQTWKAQALAKGLSRARIWVGDHGRWKRTLGRNETFRQAPHFDAVGSAVKDDALLERLLALYEKKYPDEIANWRDRMRKGYHDGSRVMIRYQPARSAG
jgi:hypothetical protein